MFNKSCHYNQKCVNYIIKKYHKYQLKVCQYDHQSINVSS